MDNKYEVITYNPARKSVETSIFHQKFEAHFDVTHCYEFEQLLSMLSENNFQILCIESVSGTAGEFPVLKQLKESDEPALQDIPIVVFTQKTELDTQLATYELGADDCISTQESFDVAEKRLESLIYNGIANRQLKDQLKAATDVAMAAMCNTSDLGVNIQFLLDSHQCENFDQLGQLFFQSLNHYGLNGSLQMRGRFVIKNMEANGMERAMESQLLDELKDKGRFYDFGYRTVVNYGGTSLLIKNMPLDDEVKYGVIKDNIFALLQGVEARIEALDTQASLLQEREMQEDLLSKMQEAIYELGVDYKELTKNIANVVDHMAVSIEDSIMTLLLTEEQEGILKNHLEQGRNSVCDLFEQNATMDDGLKEIIERVSLIHQTKGQPEYEQLIMDSLQKTA